LDKVDTSLWTVTREPVIWRGHILLRPYENGCIDMNDPEVIILAGDLTNKPSIAESEILHTNNIVSEDDAHRSISKSASDPSVSATPQHPPMKVILFEIVSSSRQCLLFARPSRRAEGSRL
jgi:hypothetical protein